MAGKCAERDKICQHTSKAEINSKGNFWQFPNFKCYASTSKFESGEIMKVHVFSVHMNQIKQDLFKIILYFC